MHRGWTTRDRFKIFEYQDYAVLLPVEDDYEECMFFFAGFNENASKYIYLFKNFLEDFEIPPKIKVVIPFLPKYSLKDYAPYWLSQNHKDSHLYAWYNYEKIDLPEGFTIKLIPNMEKDTEVIRMVKKEIEILGSSDKIFFVGFSMGGRYLVEILSLMKIHTKFNIIFKSVLLIYDNPYKLGDSSESQKFNENKFYLYYSRNDKIVPFNRGIQSISAMKANGFKNIQVKIDNSQKHVVDYHCLIYLEDIFSKNFSNCRPKVIQPRF
jgi:predicted esterase